MMHTLFPAASSSVEKVRPSVGRAGDTRLPIDPVRGGGLVRVGLSRNRVDAANLLLDRRDVLFGERPRRSAARLPAGGVGNDEQRICAQRGDLRLHGGGDAVADRHHRDHRRDADDDAEHGQNRPEQVPAYFAKGEKKRSAEHPAMFVGASFRKRNSKLCAPFAAPSGARRAGWD
jgi:hypothetical protein